MQLLSDFIENFSKSSFSQEKCLSFGTKKNNNTDRNVISVACKNIFYNIDQKNSISNLNSSKWLIENQQIGLFSWIIFMFLFTS